MYFDLHVLLQQGRQSEIQRTDELISDFLPSDDNKPLEFFPLTNLEAPSLTLSLPSSFWLKNHTIGFYKDLINLLRTKEIAFREIDMNLEDTENFFAESPSGIQEEKKQFVHGRKDIAYCYFMPEHEFKQQNKFRTQLIYYALVPENAEQSLSSFRMHPDQYEMVKIKGGYRVEFIDFSFFIGCIGYFRYIHKNDIDPRVITAIQQTKEYLVELDEYDWYFIFKYEIDDLTLRENET